MIIPNVCYILNLALACTLDDFDAQASWTHRSNINGTIPYLCSIARWGSPWAHGLVTIACVVLSHGNILKDYNTGQHIDSKYHQTEHEQMNLSKTIQKSTSNSIFAWYCSRQLLVAEIIRPRRWARSSLEKTYTYKGRHARVLLLMFHLITLFIGALICTYICITPRDALFYPHNVSFWTPETLCSTPGSALFGTTEQLFS